MQGIYEGVELGDPPRVEQVAPGHINVYTDAGVECPSRPERAFAGIGGWMPCNVDPQVVLEP
eukprot:5869652-Alexandrium_andersonii.AAC.1